LQNFLCHFQLHCEVRTTIITSFSFMAVAPPSYISHYHKLLIYGCCSAVLHQPLPQVSRFWLLLRRLRFASATITSISFPADAPAHTSNSVCDR
jgi:hypothetical protein